MLHSSCESFFKIKDMPPLTNGLSKNRESIGESGGSLGNEGKFFLIKLRICKYLKNWDFGRLKLCCNC